MKVVKTKFLKQNNLSEKNYGFTQRKSTENAVGKSKKNMHEFLDGRNQKLCVVFDI